MQSIFGEQKLTRVHKFTQHTIMDVFEANWRLVRESYYNNGAEVFKSDLCNFIGKLDEQKEVKLRYIQKLLALLGYSNLSRVEYIEFFNRNDLARNMKENDEEIIAILRKSCRLGKLSTVQYIVNLYKEFAPECLKVALCSQRYDLRENDGYNALYLATMSNQVDLTLVKYVAELLISINVDKLEFLLTFESHELFFHAFDKMGDSPLVEYIIGLYGEDLGELDQYISSFDFYYDRDDRDNYNIIAEKGELLVTLLGRFGITIDLEEFSNPHDHDDESVDNSDDEESQEKGSFAHVEDVPRINEPDCVACWSKGAGTHAFAPCGHICLCYTCAKASAFTSCPLCRSKGSPFALRSAKIDIAD